MVTLLVLVVVVEPVQSALTLSLLLPVSVVSVLPPLSLARLCFAPAVAAVEHLVVHLRQVVTVAVGPAQKVTALHPHRAVRERQTLGAVVVVLAVALIHQALAVLV
jgi:hypothetical protein